MRRVPILRCSDLPRSLAFYAGVLDFTARAETTAAPVVDLVRGDAELRLSTLAGDDAFGSAVNVHVDDVDGLFRTYVSRGLDLSLHPASPVHQGRLDQTWGRRELYVTDPDGTTLRFGRRSG